jgi:hypothetical protein
MPVAEQRQHKANPHNIQRGFAKGLLAVRQNYCAADFGSITVVGEGPFLRIDGEEILGFYLGEGNLEISLHLYSAADELLLQIGRNEWMSGDPLPWDIKADWQMLTLRERARHISLSLNLKLKPLELRAELWRLGKRVRLNKEGIYIDARACTADLERIALVGATLDVNTDRWSFGPAEANCHCAILTGTSQRDRLWKAREAWREILAARK